jgi:hypothetical protein
MINYTSYITKKTSSSARGEPVEPYEHIFGARTLRQAQGERIQKLII